MRTEEAGGNKVEHDKAFIEHKLGNQSLTEAGISCLLPATGCARQMAHSCGECENVGTSQPGTCHSTEESKLPDDLNSTSTSVSECMPIVSNCGEFLVRPLPSNLPVKKSESKSQKFKRSLQRYASHFLESREASCEDKNGERKYRSQEARAVADRHTQALFGDLDVLSRQLQRVANEANKTEDLHRCMERAMRDGEVDAIELPIEGVQCMVLQAVAFGTYLWDCERRMDMIRPLTPSNCNELTNKKRKPN